jgi:DNA-binding NarL/FixJ family response regulator
MLSRQLNLALVDDHAIFRETLKSFLSEQEAMHVAIQASDILDLLDKLRTSSIDVLLMDLFLPELTGTEALQTIHREYPDIKILILSASTDMDLISHLLDNGIHGYISKSDEPEELLQAIRAAANDQIYRNRLLTEALYWGRQNNVRSFMNGSHISLNEREKKILQLIWNEKNNKEIADELFLGVRSVEKIRQDLKEKIGAKSTVGLLKYGINKGIIRIGRQHSDLIR